MGNFCWLYKPFVLVNAIQLHGSRHTQSEVNHGIHMADMITGCTVNKPPENKNIIFHQCNADEFLRAITPHGTWTWCRNRVQNKESLKRIAQRHHFQVYRNTRDHLRVQRNTPARWNQDCAPLMATLNKTTLPLLARGRLVKHIYDWMAHSTNLTESTSAIDHAQATRCLKHTLTHPARTLH
jgi:hypothetical protein